jgi:hypothetical protein
VCAPLMRHHPARDAEEEEAAAAAVCHSSYESVMRVDGGRQSRTAKRFEIEQKKRDGALRRRAPFTQADVGETHPHRA